MLQKKKGMAMLDKYKVTLSALNWYFKHNNNTDDDTFAPFKSIQNGITLAVKNNI